MSNGVGVAAVVGPRYHVTVAMRSRPGTGAVAIPPRSNVTVPLDVVPHDTADELIMPTVDTGEMFRAIFFANGNVRAIPVGAVAPPVPTGLSRSIRVGWVNLSWTASAGATRYLVRRDGAQIASVTSPSYRDSTVTVGVTYSYAVQAVSGYELRSGVSAAVSAFIDPALNVAPTLEVRSWPTSIASGHRGYIRVNGFDADAQALAYMLSVDVGSLIATPDPSVWILEVP